MKYILVTIFLMNTGEPFVVSDDPFDTMEACFDARDKVVELYGRPLMNYQSVCVIHPKEEYERRHGNF